jgi:hypothetical protein
MERGYIQTKAAIPGLEKYPYHQDNYRELGVGTFPSFWSNSQFSSGNNHATQLLANDLSFCSK